MNPDTREKYALLIYFALSFGITIGAALLLQWVAVGAGIENFMALSRMAETTFELSSAADRLALPVPVVYLLTRIVDFGPTLAGLLAAWIVGGAGGFKQLFGGLLRWRVGWRWYAFALLFPLAVILLALGLHLGLGETNVQGANWQGLRTIWDLIFWVFLIRTLLGGGLGEEVGWRGFALPRMLPRYGAFKSSLYLGVIWTVWHVPAHLAASNPVSNFLAQTLFTIPLTFVFTWLYLKTPESLWPVVLMHGAINGFNAFFERSLFPPLVDEDSFVIFWILVVLVAGIGFAAALRQYDRQLAPGSVSPG